MLLGDSRASLKCDLIPFTRYTLERSLVQQKQLFFGKKKAALKTFYGGVERPAFEATGRYTCKWLDRFQLATLLFADNHS